MVNWGNLKMKKNKIKLSVTLDFLSLPQTRTVGFLPLPQNIQYDSDSTDDLFPPHSYSFKPPSDASKVIAPHPQLPRIPELHWAHPATSMDPVKDITSSSLHQKVTFYPLSHWKPSSTFHTLSHPFLCDMLNPHGLLAPTSRHIMSLVSVGFLSPSAMSVFLLPALAFCFSHCILSTGAECRLMVFPIINKLVIHQ